MADPVTVTQIASTAATLSIMDLFWQADIVVKAVMFILIGASFWCWTIIFDKTRTLKNLSKKSAKFEDEFWSGTSLDELRRKVSNRAPDPMAAIFVAAMKEWGRVTKKDLQKSTAIANIQQRIDRVMSITLLREIGNVEKHMTFLASTGSAAPFIGLFGTVWGIMNSFQSIAASNNTSLAVVAPGIAEALFATALGLVAAIPAVLAYNKISSDINRYAARLEAFASEFSAIISRRLDEEGNN